MGLWNRCFSDFDMISGLHFESFSGTEGHRSGLGLGFVSMLLLIPIPIRNPGTGALKTRLLYRKCCRDQFLAEVGLLMSSWSFSMFSGFAMNLMIFGALETRSKLSDFSWLPRGEQRLAEI